MTDEFDSNRSDDVILRPGASADPGEVISDVFPREITQKFEIYSYRRAATILRYAYPLIYSEIIELLSKLEIHRDLVRRPGGNKGPIVKHIESLIKEDWCETRISADLIVKMLDGGKRHPTLRSTFTKVGFLDGHRIDFVKDKVAFDIEWNSKDQTYDRDLYAFSAFYQANAIDLGIILTRGNEIDGAYLDSLGGRLDNSGNPTGERLSNKFGPSTTFMGKLLYRLEAGRNGGCPVLAIGISPRCIV